MKNPVSLPQRQIIRLKNFDYTQAGAYFVTIVSIHRKNIFGEKSNDFIQLTRLGLLVEDEWRKLPHRFESVEIDEFVVMPNHFHAVLWILEKKNPPECTDTPLPLRPASKSGSLGSIVAAFKATTTRLQNAMLQTRGETIWQRNYYEHVIRNEQELRRVRAYIQGNPDRWDEDEENPFHLR